MDDLRREIRDALVDPNNKIAFNLLYKEAWYPEEAAMGNSSLPTVLDKLCMVANIHTRNLVDTLREELKIRATGWINSNTVWTVELRGSVCLIESKYIDITYRTSEHY
jgi:hypothetical protein